MRITTKIVLDLESGETILREGYEYAGPVASCKASRDENTISSEQRGFYNSLVSDYRNQFAGQANILQSLSNSLEPLLNAGPNQTGFSAPEEAAMRTSAMDQFAAAYKNEAQAVNERLAAQGGGNNYLPSGASAEVNAQLAAQAAQANASAQQNITMQNYAQGRQNFSQALGALSGAAGLYNPEGFMGGANTAGENAFGSASQIEQQNASSAGGIGKALGSIAGAGLGFLAGGPAGATLGGSFGGSLGGAIGSDL